MKIIVITYNGDVDEVLILNDDVNHQQVIDNLWTAAKSAADGGEGIDIIAKTPSTYDEVLTYLKTI